MTQHSIFASARWTVASSIIRKLFSFALFIVIARVLTKDDVGLFREYSLILTLGSMTFLFSLDYLLIVSKEKIENNLSVIFKLILITSSIGTVILFILAPILGRIYHSQVLTSLIRYTSVFLFVENIRRLLTALMQRELRLKELAIFQTVNVIFYTLLTLTVLIFKKNVWVLVLGFYSGNVIEMFLLLWSSRITIGKYLKQKGKVREFLSSNRKFISFAWVNNILNNISGNAPVLVLGLSFPIAYLGSFYLANQIIILPITIITTALLQVFFPSFSRKANDEVVKHIGKFTDFVLIVAFPLMALYALVSYSYLPLIFGAKWVDASSLILALAFTSALSLLTNPLSGIPYSLHKPDIELYWSIVSSGLKIGCILFGAKYGFLEAIIGFVIASVISQILLLIIVLKLLSVKQVSYWLGFIVKLLPTIVLGLFFWIIYNLTSVYATPIGIVLVGIYYLMIQRFSKYDLLTDIRNIAFSKEGNRRQSS